MLTLGTGSAAGEFSCDPNRLLDRARPTGAISASSTSGIPVPVLRALTRLRELDPNWDSYGAPAFTPDARRHASDVVYRLYRAAEGFGLSIPEPHVFPSGDGMIGLYWKNDSPPSDLEVLIGEDSVDVIGSVKGTTLELAQNGEETFEILAFIHRHISRR